MKRFFSCYHSKIFSLVVHEIHVYAEASPTNAPGHILKCDSNAQRLWLRGVLHLWSIFVQAPILINWKLVMLKNDSKIIHDPLDRGNVLAK